MSASVCTCTCMYMYICIHTCIYMYNIVHHLQCKGKPITWSHLEDLYKKDTGSGQEATGLRLVPKIKFEHIYLSSFSKMRVDLAAQVMKIISNMYIHVYSCVWDCVEYVHVHCIFM